MEIQRLIGRSLRAVVDLNALGERTVTIDCDALLADGGTRCASITGGYVALAEAFRWMQDKRMLKRSPLKESLAAVSVGVYRGVEVLDLNYDEDSQANTDMNIVMTESGRFVEVQGTAENEPFSAEALGKMLSLAKKGIGEWTGLQRSALGS